MSNIRDRYHITPQMRDYDNLSCVYRPYIMFFNQDKFASKSVNTDIDGFRLNYINNKFVSNKEIIINKKEVNIVIGGSLAFGFGTTSDKKTISSLLSLETGEIFINYGATAFNAKQEFILFINNVEKFYKIKRVIIISGINDLYLNIIRQDKMFENIFFDKKFKNAFSKPKKNILDFLNKKNTTEEDSCANQIDFKLMNNNYNELFSLWNKLSNVYSFKVFFFLQPFCSWFKKELSDEELKIFDILDSSNDTAHNVLQKISDLNYYDNFENILSTNSKKNKISYSDLNYELKDLNDAGKWLFVDRVHLTDLGYLKISKKIINLF